MNKTAEQGLALAALMWTAATAAVVADGPEVDRFKGGNYDGWHMDQSAAVTLNGPAVVLTSGADQTLSGQAASASVTAPTIRESSDGANLGIKAGKTMTLAFPPALSLQWNISSLTYGGSASGKAGAASLADGNRTLQIPVTSDFAADEELVLNGLTVVGLARSPQTTGRLLLDIDEDGLWDTADLYTKTVRMIWSGGSYDGWHIDINPDYEVLSLTSPGVMITLQ